MLTEDTLKNVTLNHFNKTFNTSNLLSWVTRWSASVWQVFTVIFTSQLSAQVYFIVVPVVPTNIRLGCKCFPKTH